MTTAARRLTVVLAIVAVLLATVAGAPGARTAAAQEDAPLPLEPRLLELVSTTTFVAPDGVLELAFRLDDVPPDATLDLALHPRVQNRIRFTETVAGLRLGTPVRAFRDLVASDLPRDDDGVVRLALQLVDEGEAPLAGLTIGSRGVYPLSLTVLDREGQELDRLVSHLVRLPSADEEPDAVPLAASLVVGLGAPTAFRPDGSARLDAVPARRLGEVAGVLAEHPDVAVSAAPTPETVDALVPAGREPLVDSLARAVDDREVLASTYVPLHLASWQALDGRPSIAEQLDHGEAVLAEHLDEPVDRRTWLLDDSTDPASLATLVDLGIEQVVAPEGLLDPLDPGDFPVTMTQAFQVEDGAGRAVPAVQADSALEGHLRSTDQAPLAANRTLADLGVLYFDLPLSARGAVLRVGVEDAEVLEHLLAGFEAAAAPPAGTAPVLRPTGLDGLFDHMTTAGPADDDDDEVLTRRWRWEPPGPLDEVAEHRAEVHTTIAAYRTMVGEGSRDTAVERARRLVLLASDHRLVEQDAAGPVPVDEEAAHAYLDGATTVIGERLGAVRAPAQGSVTLTASDASVPVVVDNGLDVPVQVRLHLRSEKVDFPDGTPVDVTLAPGHNRIEVRVRARASGVFPVVATVTSPDDAIELGEARVQVRSAAVSGLGVVLSVGAGIFLCVWWARNWRKARRARSLVSPNHPALGRPDD